jgi:transposase-like protein
MAGNLEGMGSEMSTPQPDREQPQLTPWQRPLEELCCLNPRCSLYRELGGGNLTVRSGKGTARWRILRCSACQREFSERKGTAMYGSTMDPARFIAIAEHLKERCGVRATARLTGASFDGVISVARRVGMHARAMHEEKAQKLKAEEAQFDEKWGFLKKSRRTATRKTRSSGPGETSGTTLD